MKLKCPVCVKHIGAAVGMLIVLLLSLEAGLRLHGRHSPDAAASARSESPLVVASPRCFHRLKPLMAVGIDNPDAKSATPLRTNSLGLRGAEIAVPKPPGVYRVLLLGDESTLAPETRIEQTMSRQLQAMLQSRTSRTVEVINAGVPGSCPLLAYLLLKHSLVGLQPDAIVLNFDMSDVADDHGVRRYTRIDDDGLPLVCRNPSLDDPDAGREQRHRGCLLLDWAKRQLGRVSTSGSTHNEGDDISSPIGKYAWIKDRSPDWNLHVKQALKPIQHIARLSKKMSATFIVAAVPAPWQVSARASNTRRARGPVGIPLNVVYRNPAPFESLAEFANKQGVHFCNPVSAFRESDSPERLFWKSTPRFSPAGHQLYARELVRCLLRAVSPSHLPGSSPGLYRSRPNPVRSATHRRESDPFPR